MYHMRHCRIAGTNNNNNDDAAASAWKGGLTARAEMVAGKKWPKYIRSGPFHEHIWPSH